MLLVVPTPVGAVLLGAIVSCHIAYNVIVSLFMSVKFLTTSPGSYVVPVASGFVFQFLNVYPVFVIVPSVGVAIVTSVSYVHGVFSISPIPVLLLYAIL